MRFIARRGFDGVLIVLGIATIFCMIGATLALVAAISIVGLPLTFLMALIPTVSFFLLTVRVAMLAVPFKGGWAAALLIAGIVFTGVPWLINERLQASAEALAAGDHNAMTAPMTGRSLAVITQRDAFNRDQTPCDDFCLRALVSGSLDRVLVTTRKDQSGDVDPKAEAISFRMERRSSCPTVTLRSGVQALDIDRATVLEKPADAAEFMRLQIASGNCLVQETAHVADADAVVRIGRIKDGDSDYSAGLNLFADTIRADRISYWERSADGYVERYRWTGVETYKLLPILMPSYVTGYGFEISNGFLRTKARINIGEKYYEKPDRTAFFTGTLGLALNLDATRVDELRTSALNQRLDAPGEIDPIATQIAADFFQALVLKGKMTPAEAEQGMRIVADDRIPVPYGVHTLTQHSAKMDIGVQQRIADTVMDRLVRLSPPADKLARYAWSEQASSLATAVRYVPAVTLSVHRKELEDLAHREDLRVPAWQALTRLADFGAGSVPPLLYLVEDSQRFRNDPDSNRWEHPYLAGLIGICKLGPEGATAIDPLYARMDGGLMLMRGSYGQLLTNALLSIGANKDTAWAHLLAADPTANREQFDRTVERVARRGPDCNY